MLNSGFARATEEQLLARTIEDPYSELAVTLSCSESVVRQRVSRGLKNSDGDWSERDSYWPELRNSLMTAARREYEVPSPDPSRHDRPA